MKHMWVAVLGFLIVALVIAFVFKNEMEKVNGGASTVKTASEGGFSQQVEEAVGNFGNAIIDFLN